MGNVVSFDGFDLRQSGVSAFIVGWGGDPSRTNSFSERARSTSVFSSARYEPRQFTVAVEFNLNEPTLTTTRRNVVGWFLDNAHYDRERILIIEDNSELFYRSCAVVKLSEPHRGIVQFEMESGNPTWTAIAQTDLGIFEMFTLTKTYALSSGSSLSVRPTIISHVDDEFAPTNQGYVRSYLIENSGSSAIRNEPIMLNLGDTSDWVSAGKALSTGNDIQVVVEGRTLRRNILNFNCKESHLWFTMPYLEAGGSTVVEVKYGAGDNRGAVFLSSSYLHPAFAIAGSNGAFRSGSTTTLLQVTTDNTLNLRYSASHLIGGYVKILTGLNAGLVRRISANTARTGTGTPTITVETAFPYAPALNDEWVVYLSDNHQRLYLVRREAREGYYSNSSGGWYIKDPTSTGPSDIRFGDVVPGSWNRFLLQGNNDDKSQTSNTLIATNRFSILDAQRRRSMDQTLREEGAFDGVILSSAVPIVGLTCDYRIKNPAALTTYGQAKAKILYQVLGGDEWSVAHENSAVYATETVSATQTYDLSSTRASQVAFALVGMNVVKNDEDVIVSVEGEIASTNSSSSISKFSWNNILRINRQTGILTVKDANDPDSTDGAVAAELSKHEIGFTMTLNGGNMLNQAAPESELPASYREITSGPYHRIVAGPGFVASTSPRNLSIDNNEEALVIDAQSRSIELWSKTGYIETNSLSLISPIQSIPWMAVAYDGDSVSKYVTKEVVSSEFLRIPPDTSVRPTGYPSSAYVASANWSATSFQAYTHNTTTWSGSVQAANIVFTPTGATTKIVDLALEESFRVIPGQVFRWSSKIYQQASYHENVYVYLAVGWSPTDQLPHPITWNARYPVDRNIVTRIRQYTSEPELVSWQGVVPTGANYAVPYVLIYHYSPSGSTEKRVQFGDIRIGGEYLTTIKTRDQGWIKIVSRKEFL